MKYAHSIKLTVFSYQNENNETILKSFLEFFPFSLEENKIILNKTNASGFNDAAIKIFDATLTKTNLINQFMENLMKKMDSEQKTLILQQSESRLDQNLDFYLRFDKDLWIEDKKIALTDSGKCFHLKISIAAFPKNREVALNIVKELFMNLKSYWSKAPFKHNMLNYLSP